jgi:hypothetical protein
MRMARHSIWARAKIGMGWSDPTFGGFQPPKDFVGSLQPSVGRRVRHQRVLPAPREEKAVTEWEESNADHQ